MAGGKTAACASPIAKMPRSIACSPASTAAADPAHSTAASFCRSAASTNCSRPSISKTPTSASSPGSAAGRCSINPPAWCITNIAEPSARRSAPLTSSPFCKKNYHALRLEEHPRLETPGEPLRLCPALGRGPGTRGCSLRAFRSCRGRWARAGVRARLAADRRLRSFPALCSRHISTTGSRRSSRRSRAPPRALRFALPDLFRPRTAAAFSCTTRCANWRAGAKSTPSSCSTMLTSSPPTRNCAKYCAERRICRAPQRPQSASCLHRPARRARISHAGDRMAHRAADAAAPHRRDSAGIHRARPVRRASSTARLRALRARCLLPVDRPRAAFHAQPRRTHAKRASNTCARSVIELQSAAALR